MYTTMCSLLLATSSLTAGQNFFSGGCGYGNSPCDDGYGRYGSYGSYGGYGSRFANGECGGGCGNGFGFGPFGAQTTLPGQSFPYASEGPTLPPYANQDKRLAQLLKSYDEKIRDLEKRLLESQGPGQMADGQKKEILDAVERKLAAMNSQILITIQEQAKTTQPVNNVDISKELREMEARLESKIDRAKKDEERLVALQSNIAFLAQTLADNSKNNVPLAKSLEGIAQAIIDGKSTAPNLHAWTLDPRRGLIVVYLPKEARLFINGGESKPGKEVRSFISPILDLGKRYFYTLRMEVERDGKAFSVSKEVYFEPGRDVHVNFNQVEPAAGAASPPLLPPPPPPPPAVSSRQ